MSNPLNGILGSSGGGSGGSGDVVGPASATDNAIARFDGATGKLLQNSGVTVADGLTGAVVVGSTGATDERLLRADGTGGSTAQAGAAVSLTDGGGLQIGGSSSSFAAFRGQSANSIIGVVTANTVDNATPTMAQLLAKGFWANDNWADPINATHTMVGGNQGAPGIAFHANAGPSWNSSTTNAYNAGDVSLRRAGAGVLAVGDGQISWGIGKFLSSVLVEANTAGSGTPNAIAANESGTVFTNEGSGAKNYEALPTAAAGYQFTFIVQDADGMRIVANTDDTIRVIDKVTAAAGYIESTTIGSTVTLVSINAVEWYATAITGVWTDGTFTYDDTSLTTP